MKLESKLVVEVVKLKGMREVIARRMVQSKREAPHVYYDIEVEMTAAKRLKEKLSEQGYKVSYNDIIIYSVSRNLKNFPKFNAHIGDDELKMCGNPTDKSVAPFPLFELRSTPFRRFFHSSTGKPVVFCPSG